MKTFIIIPFLFTFILISYADQPAKFGKLLSKHYLTMKDDDQAIVYVTFIDKGNTKKLRMLDANSLISQRSINRRLKTRGVNNIVDENDLPLEHSYVEVIANNVVKVRHELKWFNALSVIATKKQLDVIKNFPFVREIELVGRWKVINEKETPIDDKSHQNIQQINGTTSLDYGTSFTQLNQIKVPAVHNLGIYGQGIVVGVFDNGFRLLTHEAFASMNIIAQYDFVDHKESVVPNNPNIGFGSHGVNTLSTIGGYKPGQLIGPAFKASYILARTENDSTETPVEEDNWAKAIEWADSIGVDVTSTSLAYLKFDSGYASYSWQDMDGNTTLITKAADRAVGLGIVVVNSAGNNALDGTPNTLWAPADGDSVITAGAVNSSGVRASFSSYGPTYDGRTKPDVMAMGVSVKVASSTNPSGYGSASGTSFSCPLSAGVAALILCANPTLTPMQVRDAMRQTASQAAAPDNLMGWGILNADSAIKYFGALPMGKINGNVFHDLNVNGIKDTNDLPLSGIKIHITGSVNDSTYTDSSGNFTFNNLPIGDFTITEELQTGWVITTAFPSYSIHLLHGIDTSGFTFGNYYFPESTYQISTGWNMLSLPKKIENHSRLNIYPNSLSKVFIYRNGYLPLDTIPEKIGYWIKNNVDENLIIQGVPILSDTINVSIGWNMISSISEQISTNQITSDPPGIVTSQFFIYEADYVSSDSIKPGKSYWVKVNQNGKLILSSSMRTQAASNRIKIVPIQELPPIMKLE